VFRPILGDPYIPTCSLKRVVDEINSSDWVSPQQNIRSSFHFVRWIL